MFFFLSNNVSLPFIHSCLLEGIVLMHFNFKKKTLYQIKFATFKLARLSLFLLSFNIYFFVNCIKLTPSSWWNLSFLLFCFKCKTVICCDNSLWIFTNFSPRNHRAKTCIRRQRFFNKIFFFNLKKKYFLSIYFNTMI